MRGLQAWITSAVDDKAANKALVLAASLRRVRSAKKLTVVVASKVCQQLRKKLNEAFDLVLPLERVSSGTNGVTLENYAQIQAFSLTIFTKCVYLAPQMLVLRNCDELFEKYESFAIGGEVDGEFDSAVFLFTPTTGVSRGLEESVAENAQGHGSFSKNLGEWMRNQLVRCGKLEEDYNVRLSLNTDTRKYEDVARNVIIANYVDLYPPELGASFLNDLGYTAKHAAELCMNLWNDIKVSSSSIPQNYETEPIAIIGLSFRLPGGNTPDEFWDLLVNGEEAIKPLPSFRWTKEHTYFPCKNRKIEAGFLDTRIDLFDAKFFGISPKEAALLDPQQRLLHEVTWHALEDAGVDAHSVKRTLTGIFVGSWIHDYKDLAVRSPEVDFFRGYIGNSIAATSARLSHFLGTTGPCIATESGCSSSIVALDMACKSLRNHDSNIALACGVNLLIHPFQQRDVEMVVAPDGRCKTFDAKANGFGRAEGCGVLVLKRLSDAVRDENKIWGLIRGSAIAQEGDSKSLGTPTIYCEALAMELALQDAGVESRDVSYIETHGTGTPVGDPLEVAAIGKVYSKGRTSPLLIGSVKTNVGHTESVSGITGIIKVLLSLKHDTIPPHRNLDTLNPNINLNLIPAEIPLQPVPWHGHPNKPRRAGVSSFGISGTDGHVIIEEAPSIPNYFIDYKLERPLHILKVSAKSQESLDKLLITYEHVFKEKADKLLQFADLAFSANTGRSTFNHRAVIIAKDIKQAGDVLKAKTFRQADVTRKNGSICFLFTGQGSQYPNMGSTLYATSPIFRTHFDKCSEILKTNYNIHIKEALWGNDDANRDQVNINRTLYSQTAIFCVEYCLLKLWESWGVKPDFVLGHSLGEFAAAVAAGALNFEDSLRLVVERSKLIDNLPTGKMLVVRADQKSVERQIANYQKTHPNFWADFAALNSPDQTVIAGDSPMIEDFAKHCADNSLKAIVLNSSHAFHSRHMNPMLETYKQIAASTRIKSSETTEEESPKYISGMEGKLVDTTELDADYWARHTREKVSFIDACKAVHSEGCNIFLEIGPHPVTSALMMHNLDGTQILCLPSLRRNVDDWETLLGSLSNLYLSEWKGVIDWKGFDQFYIRKKVDVPFYEFNRKPAWVKSSRLISKLHPLLGRILPNSSNQSIFESRISVKTKTFLQDHVIGNTIIFPGAAFLEVILAAGYASVHRLTEEWTMPQRAIAVNNVKISAPLAMSDSEPCLIQTIVSLDLDDSKEDDEPSYSVHVSRNSDPNNSCVGEWFLHAAGTYQPIIQKKPSELSSQINISSIQSTWKEYDSKMFYEKLPKIGLNFGPNFQSLEFGWKSDTGLLVKVRRINPEEEHESYLIHPILADAMIQATMLWKSKGDLGKKLNVPVAIGEFIWLPSSNSKNSNNESMHVYCSSNERGTYSILLDDNGKSLAYMACVEFAETSVKLIEGMMQQQSTEMPGLWEEVWKAKPGPCQNRLEPGNVEFPTTLAESAEKLVGEHNDFPEDEKCFRNNLSELTRHLFIRALYKLGWRKAEGTTAAIFKAEDLLKSLSIQPAHKRFLQFFLQNLAKNGFIEKASESDDGDPHHTFLVPETFTTCEGIWKKIERIVSQLDTTRVEYKLISEVGRILDEALVGTATPLSALFPQESSKATAQDLYRALGNDLEKIMILTMDGFIFDSIQKAIEKQTGNSSEPPPVLRILEVGAGTGIFTRIVVNYLTTKGIKFKYFYTDISTSFFSAAEKDSFFGEYGKDVVFQKLDMEEDPLEQGFCPEYFDVIAAFEVLHISKDVCQTLKNLGRLLKPGGVIQIEETITEDPNITFMFGLLEGYWRFEDNSFRQFHPTLTPEKWTQVLHSAGFPRVVWRPAVNNVHGVIFGWRSKSNTVDQMSLDHELGNTNMCKHSWLIFDDGTQLTRIIRSKLVGVNRKVIIVRKPEVYTQESMEHHLKSVMKQMSEGGSENKFEGILYFWGLTLSEDRDQAHVSLPLLTLCQLLSTLYDKSLPKLFVVTQGIYSVDDSQVGNPTAGTLPGMIRSVTNENVMMDMRHLDLSPAQEPRSQVDELFQNLWEEEKGGAAAFRNGKRLKLKLSSAKIQNEHILNLPLGISNRFQLQLPETRLISDLEYVSLSPQQGLRDDEVEIEVKAVALNFRDVFAVLKPIPELEQLNTVGFDVAGIIVQTGSKVTRRKVGDRVIGLNMRRNLAFPSHLKLLARQSVALPPQMTYAEGSTLPTVFSTAALCLLHVAKMKCGETVLIHTASGGVGLCAIQVAMNLIGADVIATAGSERKRDYLRRELGIQYVFNSRSTDFKKNILQVTCGRGVDIVLNSLTGPGFKEASLESLAENGRFVELSKMNVWTCEEVEQLRSDVFYEVVDLTNIKESLYEDFATELERLLRESLVKPIPYERFDALNIRGALTYLQKAKHIGKVVCIMPEVKVDRSKVSVRTPLFNQESTYLVTGGLGGIGFEVVKWILKNGGKHVAIASRNKPHSSIEAEMSSWKNMGDQHVESFSVDVGNFEECQQLIENINSATSGFPPLRGVMHAAGVLENGMIESQSWESFRKTFNPKVNGTWNLHDLTKDLQLEHFVLFSSMTATFGSPGQINHSASNSFEDAFAHFRNSIGLPAVSINWSNWGEVGVATDIDFPGVRPVSTSQALCALEKFLRTPITQIAVLNIESFTLLSKLLPSVKIYIDAKELLGERKSGAAAIINAEGFWAKLDAAENSENKVVVFKECIKMVVRSVLKLEADEEIEDEAEFQNLGIDSLMMLEMKNGLQHILGKRMIVTAAQLKDCNTTEMLASQLTCILEGEEEKKNLPSLEELRQLIREDSGMVNNITIAEEVKCSTTIEEVGVVLLTGGTGNLGAYLLRELTQRGNIKKIYCVIRKCGKYSATARLLSKLQKLELLNEVDMAKVECLEGDVSDARFGLSDEKYEELGESVDAIFHCAARVFHNDKYWKAPEQSKHHCRTTNVVGTAKVLEFAVYRTLKYVFHASTLLTATSVDGSGNLSEDWQDVGVFDEIPENIGYPVSKHICEQLVRQAIERGVPCKVVKLPLFGGDSRTGRCHYESNHFLLRLLAFMKLECMPDIPIPLPIIPVDKCAEICLKLFFDERIYSDVIHICERNPEVEQVIIQIAEEHGIHIDTMSFPEFLEKLNTVNDNTALGQVTERYYEGFAKDMAASPSMSCLQKYLEKSENFFTNEKIRNLYPDFEECLDLVLS